MYESFFGLDEKPFNLTPDPRYFYLSESHREALSALIYGIRERAGLITLTGPVGVGKTMILASFLDQIREHAEAAAFSGVVSGERIEFLKDLCLLLGISPEQDSLFGVSHAIKEFCIQTAEEGRNVVVLVDEAQDLGLQELEHFRHLSNVEVPEAKLVQIVLAGTDRLDERLKDKSLEALWQRVAIRCAIKPIEPEETIDYIFHRMGVAGSSSGELFSNDALRRIVDYSRGVPRLINLVCNQAMISAYSAGRIPVDEDAVLEALEELGGEDSGVGTGPGGTVGPDEIRGMVETVSPPGGEGAVASEGEETADADDPDDSPKKAEGGEVEGITVPMSRPQGFSFWHHSGRRFAIALVLVALLVMVGVVMTIGFPKTGDVVVDPVGASLSERSGEGPATRVRVKMEPRHAMPRGGDGPEVREDGSIEMPAGLLPLRWSEAEEAAARVNRSLDPHEADFEVTATSKDGGPPEKEKKTVPAKDVAGIALEHYGRLDSEVLRVLREKNPQIRDWNNLTPNMQLVLPDMPEPKNGGADFYTIQVGAFKEEAGASQRLSDLAEKRLQNLFLIRGGVGDRFTFVCVGVFESGQQSSIGIDRLKAWGFEDAFPVRIKGKRLEDIVQPYAGLASGQRVFPGT